ncbi:MAG: TonB-dependent receptor [Betaproteobacteria bacterium]|nr:TonB-dependent receptor [Rubrivivax sp.]
MSLLLSPFAVFLAAHPAHAQTAAPAAAEASQVITVTATKRNERITDVPLAVTAIGDAEIRDRGAADLRDMQYSVPGLNIQEQTPGANRIQLRGVNAGFGTGLPIVGTYLDEMGITLDLQSRDTLVPLVDMSRIEVLRGPQGTLYGEGSMAGTIRYLTRNPSLTKTDGFVEANLYKQGEGGMGHRLSGAFGTPLMEGKAGLRVAAGSDKLAGWIDYPQMGLKDANGVKRYFVRPKLLIQPNDKLSVSLLALHSRFEGDSDNIANVANPAVRLRTTLFPAKDNSDLANAIVTYDFGPVTLTSSTGYLKRDLLFTASVGGGTVRGTFDSSFKQWNQELRLSSNGDGPVQYTAGVWARDYTSAIQRDGRLVATGAPVAALARVGTDPVNSKSSAIFGDATWKLSPKVELSAGGRYYNDERTIQSTTPAFGPVTAKFNAFSPRVSGRYEWSRNASSYATLSKGFRSGGFNGNGTFYEPETLWNVEVGHKAVLAPGLFFDGVVYYADYKDRQAQSAIEISPGVFQAITKNVGKASGPGVEAAVNAKLPAGLELTATLGWNDIRAKTSNVEVLAGERFDMVSALTSSLSLSQRFAVGAGLKGMWRVDYQHADPFSAIVRQAQPNGSIATFQNWKSANQDLFNVRAGVEGADWSLTLDVKNLFDKRPLVLPIVPFNATMGEGVSVAPRSIGLTLRKSFGG